MNIGTSGLNLIKSFEKCILHPYDDGYGFLTIGWGHLIQEGEDFPPQITQAQADALFEKDLARFVADVNKLVKVPLTQNQFDALVSFHYNTGGLGGSTLLKKLNQGRTSEAAEEFNKWIYVKKEKSNGLIKRRAMERALFLKG